ncbi:MAG: tetratricopeptide repeat protein [Methanotrichaceae archaeon]|nr:tetratricopeptide repeat protein [Methanotrichaceae archaeon]
MNQLVALQEIYESFSKGDDALSALDPRHIEGSCSKAVGRLVESAQKGTIPEDLCTQLSEELSDVYEMKRLGDICTRSGLYATAVRAYNRALALCGDQNVSPALNNSLAQVYSRQGDPARAAVFFKKAIDDFRSAGDQKGIAHVTGNMALAYRRSRDWNRAIEHCYRSLKMFEEQGDLSGAAQMTGNLGRIYADMGEIDLAGRYLEKSLKEFQKLGDSRRAAGILHRLGQMNCEKRDWDSAAEYYQKSRSVFEDLGQKQNAGLSLAGLGNTYLKSGEAERAREALEQALKSLRRERQPDYQNTVSALASAYSALARGCCQEAGFPCPLSDRKAEEALRAASQYYGRCSDQYQELSSSPKTGRSEIKVAAAVALFRSYLCKLRIPLSSEETTAVAERAVSVLENAAAFSEGQERIDIQNLQRVICGMKEIWKLDLLNNEPWTLAGSVANAVEYLMGAACSMQEGDRSLCDALKNIRAAVEEERNRKDPSEKLNLAASRLHEAERRLSSAGTEGGKKGALLLAEAANSLDALGGTEDSGESALAGALDYGAYRSSLLSIGWALIEILSPSVDKTAQVHAWDDRFQLITSTDGCREEGGLKASAAPGLQDEPERSAEEDDLEIEELIPDIVVTKEEPCPGPLPVPEEIGEAVEEVEEKADAVPEETADTVAASTYPEITVEEVPERADYPVPAGSGLVYSQQTSQLLMYPERRAIASTEILNPVGRPQEKASIAGDEDRTFYQEPEQINLSHEPPRDIEGDREGPSAGAEEGRYYINLSDLGHRGMPYTETGIRLVRALAAVVVVLVAIEIILYLI